MSRMYWSVLILVLAGLMGCAQTPAPANRGMGDGENQHARIHTELAAQYFTRGQYAIALSELRIALEGSPNYAPAHNMQGLVHNELKEYPLAEASFRRAIQSAPQDSEARNNFGYFLCQRGRYDEGLVQFEAALSNPLYSSPDKALANAGTCSLDKGDLAKAEAYLRRALMRMPTQPTALLAMAELHYRRGQYPDARAALLRLSGVTEFNADALWLGVRVERKLGDKAAEASYGAQLRRRFPDSPQARLLMSGNYENESSAEANMSETNVKPRSGGRSQGASQ